eukprot:scaffold36304_cov121-Isochrysis_galbana.AAC.2
MGPRSGRPGTAPGMSPHVCAAHCVALSCRSAKCRSHWRDQHLSVLPQKPRITRHRCALTTSTAGECGSSSSRRRRRSNAKGWWSVLTAYSSRIRSGCLGMWSWTQCSIKVWPVPGTPPLSSAWPPKPEGGNSASRPNFTLAWYVDGARALPVAKV